MAARFQAARAVVFMYHSVVEDPRTTSNTIRISQSRASFERQMGALAKRFHPVSLDEIVEFVAHGCPLPRRAVCVTFDDGFADNHDVALPILTRYSIPATFYIMVNAVESGVAPWYCGLTYAFHSTTVPVWTHPKTGAAFPLGQKDERGAALAAAWDLGAALAGDSQALFMDDVYHSLAVEPLGNRVRLMMDWDQVRALKKAGHTIGGHTLSHPNLAHVSAEEARSEIQGCKDVLEEKLAAPVSHFCYPHPALNPQWSPATKEITGQAGFKSAVLTTQGPVSPGDDPLTLKRIPADADFDLWLWQLERAFAGL